MAKMSQEEAIKATFDKLMAMSDEEFDFTLYEHEGGFWARTLRESGAIDIIMEELNERRSKQNGGRSLAEADKPNP